MPDGLLLLRDLMEHGAQREFVYRHAWRAGDLVTWDKRYTLHRGRACSTTRMLPSAELEC
jgi:alpha-ketoglutarate-dependent taurine dioxygenase